MKCVSDKRCMIGEGPIWNAKEKKLYFTNGMGNEYCKLDMKSGELEVIEGIDVAAFAFDTENRLILSTKTGVYYLNEDNSLEEIARINYCNDMKVGPDGRIYVGTQSAKRIGVSDRVDGKLYSIDKSGTVRVLLEGLQLSNGLDWSMDEKHFYHTDSDTSLIREYDFDKATGDIAFTGRSIYVKGVDGFTIDRDDNLYAACWGYGHIAVIDTNTMQIKNYMPVPAEVPASCGFCGEHLNLLAITTASCNADISKDKNAGFTLIDTLDTQGRIPYLFGGSHESNDH